MADDHAQILSSKSTKTYDSVKKMINKKFGTIAPSYFIENPDEVIKRIDDMEYSISTKKMIFVVINKLIDSVRGPSQKEAHNKYGIEMMKYNNAINHIVSQNVLTEKEENKYIEYDKIIDLRDNLLKIYNKTHAMQDYYNYMLLSIYTLFPPRRVLDYDMMKIAHDNPNLSKDYNYLSIDKNGKMKFVFNVYKTSSTYGTQQFDVPDDLASILAVWLDTFQDGEFLLSHSSKYTPNENRLTKYMIRLFDRYTGIPAGVSVIRHSYISHVSRQHLSLKQREDLSKKMAHSIYLQLQYLRYT